MKSKKIILLIIIFLIALLAFSFFWNWRSRENTTPVPYQSEVVETKSDSKSQLPIEYSDNVMGLIINTNQMTVEAKMFEETDLVKSKNLIMVKMKELGIQNPEKYVLNISGPRDYSNLQEAPPELIDQFLDSALQKKQSAP